MLRRPQKPVSEEEGRRERKEGGRERKGRRERGGEAEKRIEVRRKGKGEE